MAPEPFVNWYDYLGLSRECTQKEVGRAYRKKAPTCHPDRHPGKEEQFIALQRAYDTLSDPARRAAFDADLAAREHREQRYKAQDGRRRDMRDKLEAAEAEAMARREEEHKASVARQQAREGAAAERAAKRQLDAELEHIREGLAEAERMRRKPAEAMDTGATLALSWPSTLVYSQGLLEALVRSACPPVAQGPSSGPKERFTIAMAPPGRNRALAAFRRRDDALAVLAMWHGGEEDEDDVTAETGIRMELVQGGSHAFSTQRPGPTDAAAQGATTALASGAAASAGPAACDASGPPLTEYEALTLRRLRQAARKAQEKLGGRAPTA